MKARVKATGNIADVEWNGHNSMGAIYVDVNHTTKYYEYELDFDTVYDYWTRLEHQYAGMAMQGFCANPQYPDKSWDAMAGDAADAARALVEKMKEERK